MIGVIFGVISIIIGLIFLFGESDRWANFGICLICLSVPVLIINVASLVH